MAAIKCDSKQLSRRKKRKREQQRRLWKQQEKNKFTCVVGRYILLSAKAIKEKKRRANGETVAPNWKANAI